MFGSPFALRKPMRRAISSLRNPPEVVRFYVRKKRVAMKSRLFSTTFACAWWSAAPGILTAEDFSGQRPAWVLGINDHAQSRRQFKQCTSPLYPVVAPQPQVRQDEPARQGRILGSLLLAKRLNQPGGAGSISCLGMKTQLWRLLYQIANAPAFNRSIINNNNGDRCFTHT